MLALLAGLLGPFWGDKVKLSHAHPPESQHQIVPDFRFRTALPLK